MHFVYSGMVKGTSQTEASEKIKPVVLSYAALGWYARQAGWQSLNNLFKKIYSNFLKAFRVDLKAWFYLTNSAPSLSRIIVTDFR